MKVSFGGKFEAVTLRSPPGATSVLVLRERLPVPRGGSGVLVG
jgi:hypothetical protein